MGVEARVTFPELVAVWRAWAADGDLHSGSVIFGLLSVSMMSQDSLDEFVIHWNLEILKTFRRVCC